ncbi:uncharacterized protein LOC116433771 [Nomia melanderi]|uniref:uncharacterized protein LOC116433771 n=1 Tax=Nomia melanderi TaxID=2448451 RepID=UPI003FCCF099
MEVLRKMEMIAVKHQQNFYELLPDWFLYNDNDYDFIRQQIGLALLGPNIDENRENNIIHDNEMLTRVTCDNKSCKIINAIHKQVLNYGKQTNNNGTSFIYLGVIYNISFCHNASKNGTVATPNEIYALPIFKIKRDIDTIWYIDIAARVYKSWEDYLNNNTLPKCLMVVPKNGKYQCNFHSKVTKYSSTVWLETLKSPACKSSKTALKAVDATVNVLGIASTVGIGAAALLTPVGPVLTATSLLTCGVSGIWNFGRGVTKLVDLGNHKQSVKPTNLSALSAWIGISTSGLTIAANSGTILLSKAISNGSNISKAAKAAHDSVTLSNLTVNGIGIAFQGYYLIDQYKTKKEVDFIDILMFSSHVLFFSNAIVNMKLAGELIRTSNGTVFEKFNNSLRFKRFQAEYNRINNINDSNSNGIIQRLKIITNKMHILNIFNTGSLNKHIQLNFQNGKIQINGITLVDPTLLAQQLLTTGAVALISDQFSSQNEKTMSVLKNLFSELLKNFYSEQSTVLDENSQNTDHFHDMLTEMRCMNENNAKNILRMVFKMSVHLARFQGDPVQYLDKAILFMWEYAKTNLKQNCLDTCTIFKANTTVYNTLIKIVTKVFELIDELTYDLLSAFHSFISNIVPSHCSHYEC